MIPNIGPLEIAIVLVIALIVFGPKRLPELGRSLGKGINEFREGVSKIGEATDVDPDDDDHDPVELTGPAGADAAEPEVTEIVSDERSGTEPAPEPVDGEVVPERHD